eukprot:SAG25_NODE_6177_length_581_cov_1.589212_1_plen_74_part_01
MAGLQCCDPFNDRWLLAPYLRSSFASLSPLRRLCLSVCLCVCVCRPCCLYQPLVRLMCSPVPGLPQMFARQYTS